MTVAGRRTSIRLELPMWDALQQICARERATLAEIVTAIDGQRSESTLTSAIRVFLLRYFAAAATEGGHWRAGHGALFTRQRGAAHGPV